MFQDFAVSTFERGRIASTGWGVRPEHAGGSKRERVGMLAH
jgi:hypothetical protein